MNCEYCGSPLPEKADSCPACGAPLPKASAVRTAVERRDNQPYRNYQPNFTQLPPLRLMEAIPMFFQRCLDFSGRSRRSEYWWSMLLVFILTNIINGIFPEQNFFTFLVTLVVLVPALAATVRRLHDVGKSALYCLWLLLPGFGQMIILFQAIRDSVPENQWGPNPKVMNMKTL